MPFATNDPNAAEPARAEDRPARRWISEWLPEIALLVVTTAAGLWAAGRWMDPCGDGGYGWSVVYRVVQGERLYRDVYLQHMPLSIWLLAAGARFFGLSVRYYMLANWIPAIVAALLLLRCARPLLSTFERFSLTALILASSLLLHGPGHLIFPYYPGVVHALVLSLAALLLLQEDSFSPGRAFLAGCLAGLAFGCKQEIGTAALAALATPVLTRSRPVGWFARVLAGFGAVLLPTAIFVFASAPIESLLRDNQVWPLVLKPPPSNLYFYRKVAGLARPHWALAAVAALARGLALAGALALASLALSRERTRSAWIRVLAVTGALGSLWLGPLHHVKPLPILSLSMTVAFAVALAGLLMRSFPQRAFLVAFGTFAGLSGLRTAFSTGASGHYQGPGHFASALTSMVFVLIVLPHALSLPSRAARIFRVASAVVLFALSGWYAAKEIVNLRYPLRVGVPTMEGEVFTDPPKAELFRSVARLSARGQRVLVIPEPFAIDVLFRLRDASPVVDTIPAWFPPEVERRLIERLGSSPPDLVILLNRPIPEYGVEPFGKGYGQRLAAWISKNYRMIESLPAGKILLR
jgi:hypothetical protein